MITDKRITFSSRTRDWLLHLDIISLNFILTLKVLINCIADHSRECQALFSLKKNTQKIKMSSAAAMVALCGLMQSLPKKGTLSSRFRFLIRICCVYHHNRELQLQKQFRGAETFDRFAVILCKGDNFMTFCLLCYIQIPFWKEVCSKRKELAPKGGKSFPFRVDPFQKGGKSVRFERVTVPKNVSN